MEKRESRYSTLPARFLLGLTLVLSCLWTTVAYGVDVTSPVGLWKTVDDKTGNAGAVVRIYESDVRFFGKIEQLFKPGAESFLCVACTDERKNKPIVGLIIIRNIMAGDRSYSGGDILDPDSGTVYRCNFHLDKDGSVLIVRGYIGFSLLGRSKTWHRL